MTKDGKHTYGYDAEGNLITVDGYTGTFDALGRRVEVGNVPGVAYYQLLYPPFDPNYQLGFANGTSAAGLRIPTPGGGQAVFGSTGLAQYRHPNWQGSQTLLTYPMPSSILNGGSFSPFGERYSGYPNGTNGFFAGMSRIRRQTRILTRPGRQAEARGDRLDTGTLLRRAASDFVGYRFDVRCMAVSGGAFAALGFTYRLVPAGETLFASPIHTLLPKESGIRGGC